MLDRISILKDKMLSQPRFVSIEQAFDYYTNISRK